MYLNRSQVNFFRLVLAIGVMISHSYILGGYGPEPSIFLSGVNHTLGSICVAFFFMISGFLIQLSAKTKSAKIFWKSRFLRIFPAYFALLFFTSFFLAPAIFFIQNGNLNSFWSFSDDGPFSYFIRNIVLPNHLQTGIKDVTLATPFGNATGLDTINGSLWTLPLEVRCYLLAFFITRFSPKRFKGILLIFSLCFLFCFLSFKAGLGLEIDNKTEWSLYLVFFFLLGAVVCQYSLKTSSFLRLSLTFFILGAIFPIETRILLLLPFVLAMLLWFSLGIHVKALKDYVADFSFGFYIWAWPITQCTALLFPSNHAHVAFILTIGALTFTFSAFSWYLIERPSLLRKLYW